MLPHAEPEFFDYLLSLDCSDLKVYAVKEGTVGVIGICVHPRPPCAFVSCRHACEHSHAHTHSCAQAHTHIYAHTHTCAQKHTHKHTSTQAHTQAHMHTHALMHLCTPLGGVSSRASHSFRGPAGCVPAHGDHLSEPHQLRLPHGHQRRALQAGRG